MNGSVITASGLLLAFIAAGCSGNKKSVPDAYESWPMGISIGIQTPVEKLAEVKEAGFDWVEVVFPRKRDMPAEERIDEIERFRTDAANAGISVWSVHLPYGRDWDPSDTDEELRQRNVADVGALIEMAAPLEPRKFILHASYEPITDEDREAKFQAAVRSLNALAPYAAETGAQLLIEDLPRTCLGNTSVEMHRLLAAVDPSIGVCFDTNHLLKETPQDFARSMGSAIKSLHVSDYDMVDERHWLMGGGVIEWEEVISAIAAGGYDGVFLFEAGKYDSYREVADTWEAMRVRLAQDGKK